MQTKPTPSGAIIYNVTVKVDPSIAGRWLEWMVGEHIPRILETGCFTSYQLVRLLEVDDSDGPTYAIQYYALSKADYNRYVELHAAVLQKQSYEKWGDGFMAFRSLMQVV